MTVHELKCWPKFFKAIDNGEKPFEIRLYDRDYQVGDVLVLREWLPASMEYTDRAPLRRRVTYIVHGDTHPPLGLDPSYCVMGLAPETKSATGDNRGS